MFTVDVKQQCNCLMSGCIFFIRVCLLLNIPEVLTVALGSGLYGRRGGLDRYFSHMETLGPILPELFCWQQSLSRATAGLGAGWGWAYAPANPVTELKFKCCKIIQAR